MEPLPFFSRIWFAWVVFFRVLFDGQFARKLAAPEATPALGEGSPTPSAFPEDAVHFLAILQREGRFIDFIEEDVTAFSDADIGAAARVVHAGCRKAVREHVRLAPVRNEDEGARVTVPNVTPAELKLTGNVAGSGPFTGVLRHRGWRAVEASLPTRTNGHDPRIVAQAEVEL